MNDKTVIFDTNGYRELTFGLPEADINPLIKKLRKKEEEHNISAFACPFTMMELVYHLFDRNDPSYENCKNALIALYWHCSQPSSGIRIAADTESLICNALFGKADQASLDTLFKYNQLAEVIAFGPSDDVIKLNKDTIAKIKDNVEKVESDYATDLLSVLKDFNPLAKNWGDTITDGTQRKAYLDFIRSGKSKRKQAQIYVRRAATFLRESIDSNEEEKMSDFILDKFKSALEAYDEIVTRIVLSGAKVEPNVRDSKANFVWDTQVCFMLNEGTMGGKQIVVISRDKFLKQTAKKTGLSDNIMNVEEYLSKFGMQVPQ